MISSAFVKRTFYWHKMTLRAGELSQASLLGRMKEQLQPSIVQLNHALQGAPPYSLATPSDSLSSPGTAIIDSKLGVLLRKMDQTDEVAGNGRSSGS